MLWHGPRRSTPVLLRPDLTIDEPAGDPAVLDAVLMSLGADAVPLVPSPRWLFAIFQRSRS
jgi:hypothetical protein